MRTPRLGLPANRNRLYGKCESCNLKGPNFELVVDGKRRWCYGCAKAHVGAVEPRHYAYRPLVQDEGTSTGSDHGQYLRQKSTFYVAGFADISSLRSYLLVLQAHNKVKALSNKLRLFVMGISDCCSSRLVKSIDIVVTWVVFLASGSR